MELGRGAIDRLNPECCRSRGLNQEDNQGAAPRKSGSRRGSAPSRAYPPRRALPRSSSRRHLAIRGHRHSVLVFARALAPKRGRTFQLWRWCRTNEKNSRSAVRWLPCNSKHQSEWSSGSEPCAPMFGFAPRSGRGRPPMLLLQRASKADVTPNLFNFGPNSMRKWPIRRPPTTPGQNRRRVFQFARV